MKAVCAGGNKCGGLQVKVEPVDSWHSLIKITTIINHRKSIIQRVYVYHLRADVEHHVASNEIAEALWWALFYS